MSEIWNIIKINKEWIFSGIGVLIISLIISFFRYRKKKTSGDTIETLGNQSPGKVYGNYKVEIHDERK